MSDYALGVICMTVLVLGLFAFIGFLVWLDSPRRSQASITPKETLKTPPPGTWITTTTDLPHGHQPTRTVNRANPPKGGSAVHRPQGKPIDLHTVTPPQQPSAVQLPKDGEA